MFSIDTYSIMMLSKKIRTQQNIRYPLFIFISVKMISLLIVTISFIFRGGVVNLKTLLRDAWFQWDSGWYLSIVTRGYFLAGDQQNNTPFPPLLPLLTKWLGSCIGDYAIAGLIIVNLSFLFGLIMLFELVSKEINVAVAEKTVLYIAIFPTGFIFSMFYSEPLFLLLTVASFYYASRGNWLLASLTGVLASMTRLVGIVIMPALLTQYIQDLKSNPKSIRFRSAMYIAFVPAGLLLMMLMQYAVTGDAMAFLHSEKYWDKYLAYPWVTITRSLEYIQQRFSVGDFGPFGYGIRMIELIFVCFFICVLPFLFKSLKASYAVFATIGFLIPLCSSRVQAMSRYILSSFPFFILFALWGTKNRYFDLIYILISVSLFGIFLSLFVTGRACF